MRRWSAPRSAPAPSAAGPSACGAGCAARGRQGRWSSAAGPRSSSASDPSAAALDPQPARAEVDPLPDGRRRSARRSVPRRRGRPPVRSAARTARRRTRRRRVGRGAVRAPGRPGPRRRQVPVRSRADPGPSATTRPADGPASAMTVTTGVVGTDDAGSTDSSPSSAGCRGARRREPSGSWRAAGRPSSSKAPCPSRPNASARSPRRSSSDRGATVTRPPLGWTSSTVGIDAAPMLPLGATHRPERNP